MSPPPNEAFRALFDALRQLRTAWPNRASWSWDGRMKCVAAAFASELAAAAGQAAAGALPERWTTATIEKAPEAVQSLADQYGGIRSNQLLLTRSTPDGLVAFGLWWPWGDGTTISLRIGITDESQVPELRELFATG